jgi:ABC-type cobalamin/Fe3+-siderophores transport system ATPase subunit
MQSLERGAAARWVSIAMALLKQPTVLFLDEPTSGLDAAAAAANIMREITRVAKDEKLIVVCTIHQPSTNRWIQIGTAMQITNNALFVLLVVCCCFQVSNY